MASSEKIKVLFVDDEEDQIILALMVLKDLDPSIEGTYVRDPREAILLIKGGSFDVVVSDYQMPEMDGIEFSRRLREISRVPIIIYTGKGSEDVASKAFNVGVDDYIRKEKELAHISVLAKRIRSAAENRRAERRLRESFAEVAALNVRLQDTRDSLEKANFMLADSNRMLKQENENLAAKNKALEDANRRLSRAKNKKENWSRRNLTGEDDKLGE